MVSTRHIIIYYAYVYTFIFIVTTDLLNRKFSETSRREPKIIERTKKELPKNSNERAVSFRLTPNDAL